MEINQVPGYYNSSLVEKLSQQTESLQEAFQTLSASANLKIMARTFGQILTESFNSRGIFVFALQPPSPKWEKVSNGQDTTIDFSPFLKIPSERKIQYHEGNIVVSLILPLPDKTAVAFLISCKSDNSPFTEFDKILLHIYIQVFDSSYHAFLNQRNEKKLLFDLNEKILHLNSLVDAGIELSRFKKKDVLYELALQQVCTITNASSALFSIINKRTGQPEEKLTFPPGLSADNITSSPFKIESSFEFRDYLYSLTLSEKETRKGATNFSDLDLTLLKAITRQVSASIENEFLLKQSIEKEKIEQELNVAASIQQQIIPKELPKINGYQLSGKNIPSKEVGGDYFDCMTLKNGKTALIIADVAGKGISAALLVNTLNAALYSYLDFDLPLNDLSERLNKIIFNASPSDKYITFFIAVLDPQTGDLDMLNAGHNPVLLLRKNGTLEKIEAGGVGLGMFDFGLPFEGQKTILTSGDILFLYTDGIPEAMDEEEELYSDEKMISFLLDHSEMKPDEFISAIFTDVQAHAGTALQSDDITALILRKE